MKTIIALEGMPGAGKSTVIKMFKEYLNDGNFSYFSQTEISEEGLHLKDEIERGRKYIDQEIKKSQAIEKLGDVKDSLVILDRSILSTLAYYYATSKVLNDPKIYLEVSDYYRRNREFLIHAQPDIVVIFDISISESKRRRRHFRNNQKLKNWFDDSFLIHFKEFYEREAYTFFSCEVQRIETGKLEPGQVFLLLRHLVGKKLPINQREAVPLLSLIIPTYNYEERNLNLKNLVDSIQNQRNVHSSYEIIIVDNGNSLNKSILNLPHHVKVISEPIVGLSRARNRGIFIAKGKIIAFVDDDTVLHEDWINTIINSHKNELAWCIGGTVSVPKEQPLLKWLSPYFTRFLLPPKFPEHFTVMQKPYYIIGANMSFKQEVFSRYGLFDTELGRVGKRQLSAEDTELIMRIPSENVFIEPKAIVYTQIKQERLSRVFFAKRIFWQGISDGIIAEKLGIERIFDTDELHISIKWFKNIYRTARRGVFFQVLCMIIRPISYHTALIWRKF